MIVKATLDRAGLAKFAVGPDMRHHLTVVAAAVVARAVPKTGIDTGALRASMGYDITTDNRQLVAVFGSNLHTSPLEYALHHWAPGKPGGRRRNWQGTRPWSSALHELGIPYTTDQPFEV